MWSRLFVLTVLAGLTYPTTAHALVMFGPVKPGNIVLGHDWPEEDALRELLKIQDSVGGHFIDAPTWWQGHFAVTYLYQGREVAAQRMINELNRLKLPHTTVMILDDEAFETPNRLGTETAVAFDWDLTFSETRMERGDKEALPGMNVRQIRMTIHLGDRLSRRKLRIPEWMQPKWFPVEGAPAPDTDYGPVSTFQAIARAARDD